MSRGKRRRFRNRGRRKAEGALLGVPSRSIREMENLGFEIVSSLYKRYGLAMARRVAPNGDLQVISWYLKP